MIETSARACMVRRLIEAAESDPRVVGLVDYGSTSEGRGDVWSDVDAAVFVRDADIEMFEREWVSWAAQFGTLLLAYVGGVGHPWSVYDTRPVPLRADFAFHPESALDRVLTWPNSPVSASAMILYDGTGGKLTSNAARIVGQSLAPPDVARAFEQICGDFWYYMLRTLTKLQRGQPWAARFDFNSILTGNLLALLRIEAGTIERMRATSAAVDIEREITAHRLRQLDDCIPDADAARLLEAFGRIAELGREVCAGAAEKHGWAWPRQLAERILELITEPDWTNLPGTGEIERR